MEMGKILSADVLDIIFDQRNKEYGAYDLRKNYQRRLTKALLGMSLVVVLLLITYMLVAAIKPDKPGEVQVAEITLDKVTDKEPPVEKVPPPPQKITPPQDIRIIRSTVPVIVNEEVPDDEKPPLNEDLDNAQIGTFNQQGRDFDGVQGPPVDANKGVVDAPKKQDDYDGIFRKVEIESTYPGGLPAWSKFLFRNLVYPQQAIDDGKEGTVYVQFVVDKEGNVSEARAVSGPEELYAAAVSVIKKSGRWEPAVQNGHQVASYKNQPITFKLSADQ